QKGAFVRTAATPTYAVSLALRPPTRSELHEELAAPSKPAATSAAMSCPADMPSATPESGALSGRSDGRVGNGVGCGLRAAGCGLKAPPERNHRRLASRALSSPH